MADDVENLARLADSHWWALGRRRLIMDRARRIRSSLPADLASRPTALDIGAGVGQNTDALWEAGWYGVSLELSEQATQAARLRGVPVVRADATALPVADRSVELVISSDVLEHIPDHEAAAAEMFRVLRPGGAALVAVPAHPELWSEHDVAVNHQRRYRRAELIELLRGAGFGVGERDVFSWNILLYPAVRVARVASRRHLDAPGTTEVDGNGCHKSDLVPVNPIVNRVLIGVLGIETLLPRPLRVRLPGVSLVAMVRRPA